MLEQYAIRKAVEVASEDDINKLKEIYKQLEESYYCGDVNKYNKVDTIIHETIFTITGNDILEDIVKNLYPKIQSFRTISLYNKKRYEDSFNEHKGLIEGIIDRDYEKAWKYGSIHLELARDEIINHIKSLKDINN